MYYKRSIGAILKQKSRDISNWVKWTHDAEESDCCQVCQKLNGCLFLENKAPMCPQHPNCHCTLTPIDYSVVLQMATTKSDYSKFDPYLFNTAGLYTHGKEILFAQWGYTVDDARWLQSEIEKQALEKYLSGSY